MIYHSVFVVSLDFFSFCFFKSKLLFLNQADRFLVNQQNQFSFHKNRSIFIDIIIHGPVCLGVCQPNGATTSLDSGGGGADATMRRWGRR
jgi:hypothetical protein